MSQWTTSHANKIRNESIREKVDFVDHEQN